VRNLNKIDYSINIISSRIAALETLMMVGHVEGFSATCAITQHSSVCVRIEKIMEKSVTTRAIVDSKSASNDDRTFDDAGKQNVRLMRLAFLIIV
jgi:hypothetical protein